MTINITIYQNYIILSEKEDKKRVDKQIISSMHEYILKASLHIMNHVKLYLMMIIKKNSYSISLVIDFHFKI